MKKPFTLVFWTVACSCCVLPALQYSTWHKSCQIMSKTKTKHAKSCQDTTWQTYIFDIAISSDIPDIFLTSLSDTFFLTFLRTNLLTFYLTYLVTSCNYFFDTLFLQLVPILAITVEVRHATLNSQDRSWGPAHSTELTRSQLGSGTPH